ncbi:MAG: T9SS type A sorting domain-containing protein, partial [Flavobacteriales bacterium]|nr:T9SS type A sorting domain-containing protein [Flavobacteriales bacterium]
NLLGKKIKSFNAQERTLNVSEFSPGLYFLQINTKEDTFIKKVKIE